MDLPWGARDADEPSSRCSHTPSRLLRRRRRRRRRAKWWSLEAVLACSDDGYPGAAAGQSVRHALQRASARECLAATTLPRQSNHQENERGGCVMVGVCVAPENTNNSTRFVFVVASPWFALIILPAAYL